MSVAFWQYFVRGIHRGVGIYLSLQDDPKTCSDGFQTNMCIIPSEHINVGIIGSGIVPNRDYNNRINPLTVE